MFQCFCGHQYEESSLEWCPRCNRSKSDSWNDAYDYSIICAHRDAREEAERYKKKNGDIVQLDRTLDFDSKNAGSSPAVPASLPGLQSILRLLDEQEMKMVRYLMDELAKRHGEDYHGVLLKLGIGCEFSEAERIAFVKKIESVMG